MEKFDDASDQMTGCSSVDFEHRRIFEMVSELQNAIDSGAPVEELRSRIHRLALFILGHFQNEEALMENLGYPFLESHKAVHTDLLRKMRRLVKKPDFPHDLGEVLCSWIGKHVGDHDIRMIRWIQEERKELFFKIFAKLDEKDLTSILPGKE